MRAGVANGHCSSFRRAGPRTGRDYQRVVGSEGERQSFRRDLDPGGGQQDICIQRKSGPPSRSPTHTSGRGSGSGAPGSEAKVRRSATSAASSCEGGLRKTFMAPLALPRGAAPERSDAGSTTRHRLNFDAIVIGKMMLSAEKARLAHAVAAFVANSVSGAESKTKQREGSA